MKKYLFTIIAAVCSFTVCAASQECDFRLPMDIPLDLAATFAELRPNHFHAGLDMRTEQVEGKAVHAVEDGYVSRISVSGYGYGNCLYIAHPCGITSVYAHLQSFSSEIDSVLKARQYAQGQFNVDFELDASVLPVTRGEFIALSGNSGSSTGPHLHFEFRKTGTDEMIDPQNFYDIYDNVRPRIHDFSVTPLSGHGVVDNSSESKVFSVRHLGNGRYGMRTDSIKAWGTVGLELRCNDYMPTNGFKFGLRHLRMFVDNELYFEYDNDHYRMDSTRHINSFINYARWYDEGDMSMRCYLLPNSYVGVFKNVKNGGYVNINEQRPYKISFEIEDFKGNKSELDFSITGDSTVIPLLSAYNGGEYFPWNYYNEFEAPGVKLLLPSRSLYDDCFFTYSTEQDSSAYSAVHSLGDPHNPLDKSAEITIELVNDTLPDKSKYFVAQMSKRGTYWNYAGCGRYENGQIKFKSCSFGTFKVLCDTIPPVIKRPQRTNGGISFKVYDYESGVKCFRGTVDKQFAIFYIDGKRNTVYCNFDKDKILKGRNHSVKLVVEDNCGNTAEYETTVWW